MSRQFVWMRRRPVRVQHGYIRVRSNGLYVSLPADQVPWGRKSCRVEVGFDTGAVAIRRVGGSDGFAMTVNASKNRFIAHIHGRELCETASVRAWSSAPSWSRAGMLTPT